MIKLHRLAMTPEPFWLNPDLIATIEATPDSVVSLTTGGRMLVTETPEQIADAIHAWRASVLTGAVKQAGGGSALHRRPSSAALSLVRGTAAPEVGARVGADQEDHRQ